MFRVAVLKPDHLGDLVLASPAIRAIRQHFGDISLWVSSHSLHLARFLFPDLDDLRTVDFEHLSRTSAPVTGPERLRRELDAFDFLFCLRDDPVLREFVKELAIPSVIASGSHRVHETALQKVAVSGIVGAYSRTEMFSRSRLRWPGSISHVGACIAAGFPTNRWANVRWLELATTLVRDGIRLSLIGGPGETDELAFLSRIMRHLPHRVIRGGADIGEFLAELEPVDVIVASDGGTAHLCSLRKPICSVFGSSPWRRYAPFGADNVVITRDVACSPCVQFSSGELNGCMTRECMAAILPRNVRQVLDSNGLDFSMIRGVRVERGVSHRYEA